MKNFFRLSAAVVLTLVLKPSAHAQSSGYTEANALPVFSCETSDSATRIETTWYYDWFGEYRSYYTLRSVKRGASPSRKVAMGAPTIVESKGGHVDFVVDLGSRPGPFGGVHFSDKIGEIRIRFEAGKETGAGEIRFKKFVPGLAKRIKISTCVLQKLSLYHDVRMEVVKGEAVDAVFNTMWTRVRAASDAQSFIVAALADWTSDDVVIKDAVGLTRKVLSLYAQHREFLSENVPDAFYKVGRMLMSPRLSEEGAIEFIQAIWQLPVSQEEKELLLRDDWNTDRAHELVKKALGIEIKAD